MTVSPAAPAPQFLLALDTVEPMRATQTPEGATKLGFTLKAGGLYQLNLFLDAREFDWEELYQTLNQYGNTNMRTGPWDFHLFTAAPLVPSYWVKLDGKKIGLWYVQRVMLEDIEAKRFRGRLALWIEQAGEHELTLEPYRPFKVSWQSAILEADPEDTLEPATAAAGPETLPVAQWVDAKFWAAQRAKLATTHAAYRKPLELVWDWALKADGTHAWQIAPLVAAHDLGGRAGAIEKALAIAKHWTDIPAWGRPREDVYGHNGDIGGADVFRCMAWAYHLLAPHMTAAERERMLKKIEYQGDQLIAQTLLMRDYWGGSVLQDHGRQAVLDLATGALHLWGISPRAEKWIEYALPRARRSIQAAPPDGVLPGSSYYAIFMYVHNACWLRDALLARTGEDLFDEPSLRNVPAYVAEVMHEPTHSMLIPEGRIPLVGGQALMATLASKHRDGLAQRVHDVLIDSPEFSFFHGGQAVGFYVGLLWGFFAYDPTVKADVADASRSAKAGAGSASRHRHLLWYEDAGFAQYRDDASGVVLAVRCGPWLGYHAQRKSPGPCDRMDMSIGAGHFVVYLDGKPLLATPEGGYRLKTFLRSCLLVDGQGQVGDVGYPMSIPSFPHRGEEIETARLDAAGREGLIRLNLTRSYPASAGVAHYTRQFLVGGERRIICRDHVVLDRPRDLSWLFHYKFDDGGVLDGTTTTIGVPPEPADGTAPAKPGPVLRVTPRSPGMAWKAELARTEVVWSYASASNYRPFYHVRYDATEKAATACVDFVIEW
ncbi:MAG: hypothetical protein NTW19_18250 [Planctomycetota bacterium]|nr:hypothetical protein [Planctomycetota bacterium]